MNKLIEKAKKEPARRSEGDWNTKEHRELALAWARDEIGHNGIMKVLNVKGSNVYNFLALSLRQSIRNNELSSTKKKK